MPDERRMTARDTDSMTFGAMQLGNGGDRTHANADALVIGQRHDSCESTMIFPRDHRNRGTKIHGNAFPRCQVTAGGDWQLAVQIVMALKQLPRSHPAAMDFQFDRRSSPRRI